MLAIPQVNEGVRGDEYLKGHPTIYVITGSVRGMCFKVYQAYCCRLRIGQKLVVRGHSSYRLAVGREREKEWGASVSKSSCL